MFNFLRSSLVSSAAVVMLCFAGCSEFVNTHCPIMGHEIDESEVTPDLTRDWNDKKVAFCCPPCLEEWDEMSEDEKAKAVANPPKKAAH